MYIYSYCVAVSYCILLFLVYCCYVSLINTHEHTVFFFWRSMRQQWGTNGRHTAIVVFFLFHFFIFVVWNRYFFSFFVVLWTNVFLSYCLIDGCIFFFIFLLGQFSTICCCCSISLSVKNKYSMIYETVINVSMHTRTTFQAVIGRNLLIKPDTVEKR